MKSLYKLYHYHKILKDEEASNVKALGIFASREQVNEAIEIYKQLPGFRKRRQVFDEDEYGEGFFISPMPVGISYWDDGFTPSGYIHAQEEVIKINLNLPYWFRVDNIQMQLEESSNDFAERVMKEKYNTSDYPRDPQSEFYQIKKFKELHNKNLL